MLNKAFVIATIVTTIGAVVACVTTPAMVGLAMAALAVAFGWMAYVTRGPAPHTRWTPELESSRRAVVYWKDGCKYCHRLLRALPPDNGITWVNVYRDRSADRRLRQLNRGDQLTPTAVVEGRILTNPSPTELLNALGHESTTPSPRESPSTSD